MAEAAPPPSAGVYFGLMEDAGTNPRHAMHHSAEEYAKQYAHKLKTMFRVAGIERAPPVERLYPYLMWDEAKWQLVYVKYPTDPTGMGMSFEDSWADFTKLKERALAGDWGPEVAAVVADHWSQVSALSVGL